MKKLFALMLALSLMLGCAALADDLEFNWADYEGQAEGGSFVTVEELGLSLWLPDGYADTELTEEAIDAGCFKAFFAEDGSGVAFLYVEAQGADLMEAVNAIEGATDPESMIVNGLSCVNYDMKEENATCLAFSTEKDNILVIMFGPISDEEYMAKARIIMASIQSAE